MWVDVIVILVLIFSFIGGVRTGAVSGLFSLLTTVIAIPVTGALYGFVASWLSFLPGEDWENFLGFLFTLVVMSIILSLIFLIPRHLIGALWNGGFLFRIIGGVFGVINSAIGLVVFVFLIQTYPIIGWIRNVITDSTMLTWLAVHLDVIRLLLPAAFQGSRPSY